MNDKGPLVQLTDPQRRYLVINVIGLAMIAGVFIYAAIVEVISRWFPLKVLDPARPETAQMLRYLFVILSLGHYFLIRLFQGKMVARNPQFLPQAAVLTFALCEAVAIYGLVLFFLTNSTTNFYLFFALSLFYFYIFYPRFAEWERLLGPGGPSPPSA